MEAYGLVFAFLGGTPTFALPYFEGEIAPVWSRAAVVDVAAPLSTLVANSYDGQHFAAVHDRELVEPPLITRSGVHHIAIHYRAKVVGQRINDRFMRAVGINRVGITIHCWGGSVLHVYNERTANTILVALLPVDDNCTRVFVLTALQQQARGPMRMAQWLQLALSRRLAVAFLRPDMSLLEGMTMRPRVLLPEVDDCLVAWLRYWRGLPRADGSDAMLPDPEQSARHSLSLAALPQPLGLERESLDA
jgi:hypothetical protein